MAFTRSSGSTFRDVVLKDCYLLNHWPNNFFDTILDIGANEGIFCLYARMRHPSAAIHAYEPCRETFDNLLMNTSFMWDITYANNALGNGQPLLFYNAKSSAAHLFYQEGESPDDSVDSYSMPSCTFGEICQEANLEGKHYIKIDCEGGERFMLDDPDAINILKKAHGVGLEVHFVPTHPGKQFERYRHFPGWKQYDDWVRDNFSNTHDIVYHASSRSKGTGVYVLILRETQ